jgi:hypothetical protein
MLSGVRAVAAVLYRLIARTRHLMPGGSPCLSSLRRCGARRRRPANRLAAIEDRLSDVPLVRGTTVHINQIKDGRAGDRYSGVVIMDDGDHLVLQAVWLHENELGVVRIEPGDVATEHYWRSRYFSIWEVRGPAGLRGWYCNVARPVVLSGGTIESRDLELDVWISADWTTHVILDEDEFDASPLIARHPGLATDARRAARFLSELTPQRLQELLATEPAADVGRRRHHRPA